MSNRRACALALVVLVAFGISTASSAQSARVIKVALDSYTFEPNILTFNEGDRVVLQLDNIDAKRGHSFASPYFSTVDLTVRGDAKQAVTPDGWKVVQLGPQREGGSGVCRAWAGPMEVHLLIQPPGQPRLAGPSWRLHCVAVGIPHETVTLSRVFGRRR